MMKNVRFFRKNVQIRQEGISGKRGATEFFFEKKSVNLTP